MNKFDIGQKVYFDSKTDPTSSGEYIVEHVWTAGPGFIHERTKDPIPEDAIIYKLKGIDGFYVCEYSLRAL